MNISHNTTLSGQTDALILCGGKGTRFRPVAENIPKVMADIHGRPFLDLLIEYLLNNKLHKIILCLGYMADYIKNYYENSLYKDYLFFSEEPMPLGTGGAIKNAQKYISTENFLVVNGDSFCNCPLRKVVKFHISRSNAVITLVLTSADDRNDTGNVIINKDDFSIESFLEKSSLGQKKIKNVYVNAGIYIFNAKILDSIPANEPFSLEYSLFPQYEKKGAYGFIHDSSLIDIGTPERYQKALHYFKTILIT